MRIGGEIYGYTHCTGEVGGTDLQGDDCETSEIDLSKESAHRIDSFEYPAEAVAVRSDQISAE